MMGHISIVFTEVIFAINPLLRVYCLVPLTPGYAVADLGVGGAPSPLRTKIFSISCSFFLENLAKLYVGAPPNAWRPLLRGILDLPLPYIV